MKNCITAINTKLKTAVASEEKGKGKDINGEEDSGTGTQYCCVSYTGGCIIICIFS